MSRLALLALLLCPALSHAQQTDLQRLQGSWEIISVMDDGALIGRETIRERYGDEGRLTVRGQFIEFTDWGNRQQRSLPFTLNEKASPKTLDMAGAEKTGGQGIYQLLDDLLLICLTDPDHGKRPTEFSARRGSPNLLMTLSRVKVEPAREAPATPVVSRPVEQPKPSTPSTPAPTGDEAIRESLVGTWGHQSKDWVTKISLNPDGTFGYARDYKDKFGKMFNSNTRASGTWKVSDGVLIATITVSTDKDQRGQIFSYRFRSVTPHELIAIDQFGNLRREWKTR